MQHPLINIATQAARAASRIILRYFDQLEKVEINEKSRNDFVTNVDHLAEAEIIAVIEKAYPNHSIIAEESGTQTKDNPENITWIIDPLDGTANFSRGLPHFSISIAIKKNNELEAGLIYDPIRNELFTALKGSGAFLDRRRIRVSTIKSLDQALLGTGFPFRDPHHTTPYMNTFKHIFPQCSGLRRAGSAALDLAYIAAGRLDGFWEPSLKEWDIAAGALMIQEAGGMICDFNGQETFLETGSVIAGNPRIFKLLSEEVFTSLHQ